MRFLKLKYIAKILGMSEGAVKAYLCHYTLNKYFQRHNPYPKNPNSSIGMYFQVTDASLKLLGNYLLMRNKKDAYNRLIEWNNLRKRSNND